MLSKNDRSESQLNRRVNRAMELLTWIGNELGHEDFSLEQILDTMPLNEPVKPEEMAAVEQRAARLQARFARLESQKLIEKGKDGYLFTEIGKKRAESLSRERLKYLFNAAPHSDERVRWSTIGGKPFDERQTEEKLVNDLLLQMYTSNSLELYGYLDERFYVGLVEQDQLKGRQSARRQQLNERSRTVAAFNWLKEQGLVESLGDDEVYSISLKGDQHLESVA